MTNPRIFILAVLVFLVISAPIEAQAQAAKSENPDLKVASPRYVFDDVDCNYWDTFQSVLDFASIESKSDEKIFIITRRGTGERSATLSKYRLLAPKNYLNKNRWVPESRIVAAEAEPVKGPGLVEIYLGSRLYIVFKMKRHQHFGQGPLCKISF